MKLKRSILGIFLFFSLVPLCIFGMVSIHEMNLKTDLLLRHHLQAISENQVAKIQAFANERREAMGKLANYELVQDAISYSLGESDDRVDSRYLENILKEHKNFSEYIVSVSIIDRKFHVVASSEDYTVGECSRLKDAEEKFYTGEFIIGNVYERETGEGVKRLVEAHIGVYDEEVLQGYISVELDVTYFDELRMKMDFMSEGTFYLLDGNYAMITAGSSASKTSLETFTTKSKGPSDFQKKWSQIDFEQNPSGELTYTYNHNTYVTYYSNIENTDWGIRISENMTAQKRELKSYTILFLFVLFILAAGITIVESYVTHRILDPLQQAVQTFHEIEEKEDYSLRMPVESKNEIGSLMQGINELLTYIEKERLQEKRLQSDLKIRAESDPLTGVKNKRCIETYVMDKLRLASESGQQITVGFLDIDDFRRFNTEYGHQQADEAICYVAKTMQEQLKGEVGRIGGDEFLFCYQGFITEEELEQDGKRVLHILKAGFVNPENQLHISVPCSFGIVTAQGKELNYLQLVRMADQVMYRAKNSGKNTVIVERLSF